MAKIQIPEKAGLLLEKRDGKIRLKKKRFIVLYGGRGSAKSRTIAEVLTIETQVEPLRVLCTREFQGSIKESVHRLLSDTITRQQANNVFDVLNNGITNNINGSEYFFEGLKNNVTKIKSMEGVDICWCEEAENITEFSWDVLIPTIRKKGSQIIVTFNPYDETDETWQRFIVPFKERLDRDGFYEDEDYLIIKMNYRDNPWFPEELEREMQRCKIENHGKYLHIWEGETNSDYEDSIIQPEWFDAAIDAHIKYPDLIRGTRAAGFDPADTGKDNKAIALLQGVTATNITDWSDGDLEDGIERAYNLAFEHRASQFVYDSVGVGAGVKMKLKKLIGQDQMAVHGFGGGDMPDNPDKNYQDDRLNKDVFRNKRAQYWWLLRDRFFNTYRAIKFNEYREPDEMISISSEIKNLPLIKSELCRVQRKHGVNQLIQLESKDEMRRQGKQSPNMGDALMMAFSYPAENKKQSKKIKYPNRGIV